MQYTKQELMDSLKQLGVASGMMLGIHASFKSLGPVAGGAETVIQALLEVIGIKGTLLMPTHSAPKAVWSQLNSPSNCGYLTEYFRTYHGVKRSLHPTHSCSAIGRESEWLLAGHPTPGAEAPGCPFHRLATGNGFVMMIGTKYNACTLLHVAEELEQVPYIRHACHESYARSHLIIAENGREIPFAPVSFPGCSHNFTKVEGELDHDGLIRHHRVGNAECTLALASDILRYGRRYLRSHPGMFLCDRSCCTACQRVRKLLQDVP